MGNPLKFFKLAIMKLQVKELQKDDVKACSFHDKSCNEKQLMEGRYSIVYDMRHLELHKVDAAKTTN